MMLSLIRPKFFIPVHGEYRHLKQHAKLAQDLGIIDESHIEIAEIGDEIEIKSKKMQLIDEAIPSGALFVDGHGKVSHEIIKERRQLSSEGVIVVVCKVNKVTKTLSDDILIKTKGIDVTDEMIDEIKIYAMKAFSSLELQDHAFDEDKFTQACSKKIMKRMEKLTTQKPVIIPIVMDDEKGLYE